MLLGLERQHGLGGPEHQQLLLISGQTRRLTKDKRSKNRFDLFLKICHPPGIAAFAERAR